MAYSEITDQQIAVGQPTAKPLFQKIKDGLADHEERVSTLETTLQTAPPIKFVVKGGLYLFASSLPLTGVGYERVWANIVLTSGRLFIVDAGTAGTADVDIKYFRNNVWASIFSTRPTAPFGAGSYHITTNGILAVTELLAGDVLRLDVNTVQIGNQEFHLELGYRVA